MTKAGFRTAALLSAWQLSQVTWFEQVQDEPLFAARCVLELLIRADAREPTWLPRVRCLWEFG